MNHRVFVVALCAVAAPAYAYNTNDNWCDYFNIDYQVNSPSFADRGFDMVAAQGHIEVGAAWLSEAQASLRMNYVGETSSTEWGEPGPVYARCQDEDDYLADNLLVAAYTNTHRGWHPSCDFWGLNIDRFRMVVNADLGNAVPCGQVSKWALHIGQARAGETPMFEVMAHEFGHVMGLTHEDDLTPRPLMASSTHGQQVLTYDDQRGIQEGLGEGLDARQLRTTVATESKGGLTFWQPTDLRPRTVGMWKPAIAANGNSLPAWDYLFGWIDPKQRAIHLMTGRDDARGDLVRGPVIDTQESSRAAFGVAVGTNDAMGMAWVGTDPERTLNFSVSHDGGATWAKTVFKGQRAVGGVSLTFHGTYRRWVMTWVHLGFKSIDKYRIATVVSDDASGLTWSSLPRTYGDDLVMPNHTPVIDCSRTDTNECLMVYRSYAASDPRVIRQQAFRLIVAQDNYLEALETSVGVSRRTSSELGLARGRMGYIMAWVSGGTNNGELAYRLKDAPVTDPFNHPSGVWSGGELTRSGFGIAVNPRNDRIRVVWKDQ